MTTSTTLPLTVLHTRYQFTQTIRVPETLPGWLDAISTWLPTRAGRDLVVSATTGAALPGTTLLVLGGWSLLAGSLAVWAYRRDEGRRFQ